MIRRRFLKQAMAAGMYVGLYPLGRDKVWMDEQVLLTILHTNDVHSRMDPFPAGSGRNEGLGGVTRRAALINQIRNEARHTLLLDAGDMLQGTPYFNLYEGKVEFEAMNAMKYDAATIGNHDFDAGIDKLSENADLANFSLVNCNYRWDETPLIGKVDPYIIKAFENIKVGIFGVGIELDGLVPKAWYGETHYENGLTRANQTADHLHNNEKCDYIICLSHLGYNYDSARLSDVVLAQSSKHINLIIGGHTHTFLDIPDVRRNLHGNPVIISQVGWAGIKLGRLDVVFDRSSKKSDFTTNHTWVNTLGK